jgi:hypothetical protein
MPEIYGFTLLRNGIKYDYPFAESLSSLRGLVKKTYVALGASDDGTEEAVKNLADVETTPTIWDENLRTSGVILSQQTNVALEFLRRAHPSGWGIYLQADEVINEADHEEIRKDIARADAEGCDAISFRYLHFWKAYDRIAITARWYPQEIRAVRIDSKCESYGDAQSFRGWKKIYYSDVPVFHYGHVREAEAYEKKKTDFNRWWHSDAEMPKVKARGEKREKKESILRYLGPHPAAMARRIGAKESSNSEITIYGLKKNLPDSFWEKVKAPLRFTADLKEALRAPSPLFLRPAPWWAKLIYSAKTKTAVPMGMHSPQARPWPATFRALLLFSERGIAVR